jgi:hypothetical protein
MLSRAVNQALPRTQSPIGAELISSSNVSHLQPYDNVPERRDDENRQQPSEHRVFFATLPSNICIAPVVVGAIRLTVYSTLHQTDSSFGNFPGERHASIHTQAQVLRILQRSWLYKVQALVGTTAFSPSSLDSSIQ